MKLILFFVFEFISMFCFGQDFNEFLDKSELDSINNGRKIIKSIDSTNCKEFGDFQGNVVIWRSAKKYNWNFTGIASKFSDNRKLVAQFDYDSIGQMKSYHEFADNGEVIYACTYNYETINDCYYRLEHLKLFYKPNSLREEGWRYVKIKDKNGRYCENTSQHKYGNWTFYLEDGTVKRNKDYGEIK